MPSPLDHFRNGDEPRFGRARPWRADRANPMPPVSDRPRTNASGIGSANLLRLTVKTLLICVVLTAVSVVPIFLTLVIGSFASIVSNNMTAIMFHGGEDGSTAGSGPEYLFFLLLKLTGGAIFACGLARIFLLRTQRDLENAISGLTFGVIAGAIVFLLRVIFADPPSFGDWAWAPVLAVVGWYAGALRSRF